jgi:hypothetical protein
MKTMLLVSAIFVSGCTAFQSAVARHQQGPLRVADEILAMRRVPDDVAAVPTEANITGPSVYVSDLLMFEDYDSRVERVEQSRIEDERREAARRERVHRENLAAMRRDAAIRSAAARQPVVIRSEQRTTTRTIESTLRPLTPLYQPSVTCRSFGSTVTCY